MWKELKESFYLFLANNLPRINKLNRLRPIFLRNAGLRIGHKTSIWRGIDIRPIGSAAKITIGNFCFLNTNIKFAGLNNNAIIRIGDGVAIGPDVHFHCLNHNLKWNKDSGWGGG